MHYHLNIFICARSCSIDIKTLVLADLLPRRIYDKTFRPNEAATIIGSYHGSYSFLLEITFTNDEKPIHQFCY